MKYESCLHYELCSEFEGTDNWAKCEYFADKDLYIKLPCRIGAEVYAIAEPCSSCEYYNEPMKEEFIERCRSCEKREIITIAFDSTLIDEFGKTVFLARQEAAAALGKSGAGESTI